MNKPTELSTLLFENEAARMRRDVAIIKRKQLEPFADDKAIEGRALNYEDQVDQAAWRREFMRDEP